MEAVEACDLCGSRQQRLFEVYERYGETFHYVECLGCGLAFLNPRPSAKDMTRFYDKEYEDSRHSVYRESRFRRRAGPIARWFLRTRYEGKTIASALLKVVFFPLEMAWQRYLRKNPWMKYVPRIGRFLDVGCGRGGLLAKMRFLGFDAHGCEPSPTAAAVAQGMGLQVICSDLPGAKYPSDYFDIVHVRSVLEHVHDPTAVISEIKRILKPDGVAFIDVPNHEGVTGKVIRNNEDVPMHLYSYSPATLGKYFDKAGLRVVSLTTKTRFPHMIYGYFGAQATAMVKPRGSAELIAQTERFWAFDNAARRSEYLATTKFFDSIGHGCHILAIASKNS